MTSLRSLLNPPPTNNIQKELYLWMQTITDAVNALIPIQNHSQSMNANFNTLGPSGTTPTTQADGDNAEFMDNWFVVGSSVANYTLTPTPYSNNSSVSSDSNYYVNNVVTSYSGSGLYFYQRQMNTVRKYQQSFVTLSISANNNTNNTISLRFNVNTYYNPSNNLQQSGAIYLKPRSNTMSSTLQIPAIGNTPVGSGNYTDFQLAFVNLSQPSGTCDFDLYQLKIEFGNISTPLNGSG